MSSEMRVSDAEREATASELREHYASGRLTDDELNQRLDQAFGAKTRADLDTVMRDLPSLRPGTPPLAGAGQAWGPGPGSNPGNGWGQGRPGQDSWGRSIGPVISTAIAICVLAGLGLMAAFGTGHGGGRPVGVILLLAAFALLRRLIFGRRHRVRTRQRRRRY